MYTWLPQDTDFEPLSDSESSEMDRVKCRKPPIEEAVCDLQFAPGTEWDPTMPGRIYEKLKGTYNEKPRQRQLIEAQIQGSAAQGSSAVSVQQRFGKSLVQLCAETGTRIVLEGSMPNLSHFFTIPPRFPDVAPATKMLAFFNRKEVEYLDKPIRAVVTFANVESPMADQSAYLLDIDLIWIAPESPILMDDLPNVLEEIKVRHRQVFESLITDASRSLFNAD